MSDLDERAVDFEEKYGWSPDYGYDVSGETKCGIVDGHIFDIPTNVESTKDQDIINWLRSENAYLRGKIEAYEKFLKDKGYIKDKE